MPRIKQDQKEKRIEDIPTKRSFEVGKQVLVRRIKRTKDQEEGVYEIVKKVHLRRYCLRDTTEKTIERNIENMKQFFKEGGCEE